MSCTTLTMNNVSNMIRECAIDVHRVACGKRVSLGVMMPLREFAVLNGNYTDFPNCIVSRWYLSLARIR